MIGHSGLPHGTAYPYQACDIGLSSGPVLRQWSATERRFVDLPLPLGAIVASCVITDAVPMESPRALNVDRRAHLSVSDDALVLYRPDTPAGWTHRSVSDQRPYGDYRPGRWAWLLDNVKPTTDRCPACWGYGWDLATFDPTEGLTASARPCATCDGAGACDPVPAKGRQGVWEWTP